jgi:hypothetical protein
VAKIFYKLWEYWCTLNQTMDGRITPPLAMREKMYVTCNEVVVKRCQMCILKFSDLSNKRL